MGRDKALLPHPVSGLPLIVHQANTLRAAGCTELFLSVRTGVDYPQLGPEVARITDDGVDGPLSVIDLALGVVTRPVVFLLAVDMPFVTAGLVRALVARSTPEHGAAARFPHGFEPLCAAYASASRPVFSRALREKARALQPLLARGVREGWMLAAEDLDPAVFANWNTPGDLLGAQPPHPS